MDPQPSSSNQNSKTVRDLDSDVLVHCARNLSLQDLANMAMTCKFFRRVAYNDSIWRIKFRDHWPEQITTSCSQILKVREAYLARHTAVHQFKFVDPLIMHFQMSSTPYNHLLLEKDNVILAQGSVVQILKINTLLAQFAPEMLEGHNARITCMRLFPLKYTSLFRSEAQRADNVLITASSDRTIRLWWKAQFFSISEHFKRCKERCYGISEETKIKPNLWLIWMVTLVM